MIKTYILVKFNQHDDEEDTDWHGIYNPAIAKVFCFVFRIIDIESEKKNNE